MPLSQHLAENLLWLFAGIGIGVSGREVWERLRDCRRRKTCQ